MLTHIRPAPEWFAHQGSPPLRIVLSQFKAWGTPGTAKCPEFLRPPRALPPAARRPAPRQRALPRLPRYYGLMRRTDSLLPPRFYTCAVRSLQVVVSPCWESVLPDVISAVFVRVPGPIPRSVPWSIPLASLAEQETEPRTSASPKVCRARHAKLSCHATSTGGGFRGGSHSLMFRHPGSLGPQIAPTAAVTASVTPSSRAVYLTQ